MGLGRFDEEARFKGLNNLALRIIEGNVHFGQQSRSQALNTVNKISIYKFEDDQKAEEREILIKINLEATNSIDFLEMCKKSLKKLWAKYQDEGENFESSDQDGNSDRTNTIETDLDDVVESAERELKKKNISIIQ